MACCRITLKPYEEQGAFTKMDVTLAFAGLGRAAGEELCRFQLRTVSIPGCRPENTAVTDAAGAVPLRWEESSPYPYELLHLHTERATEGPVTVTYTVYPRPFAPEDRCGPYFDLKAEAGGANSAGLSFLPSVEGYTGDNTLHWELSAMAAGSVGVCTWGEGDVSYTGSLDKLHSCYYAFGPVKSLTEGEFGFYWLTEPDFDVRAIAAYTKNLFGQMQRFFRDDDPVYRIFVRKDPYESSGGTALYRSYMFGWNDTEPVTVADKQNILAHEMVHNWPHLNDNPYGTASWYSEGTAEFYSIMLPLRMGLIDTKAALHEIQTRTDNYYTNPTRHMENLEAAKICWQDRRAQRLAYGRGVFFLANVDVMIRRATGGERSLDDVVLEILEKDRAGVTLGNAVFLSVVRELSGLDVTAQWETMRTGGHFAPLPGSFDGHFAIAEKEMPEADTGKPVVSYQWTLLSEEN